MEITQELAERRTAQPLENVKLSGDALHNSHYFLNFSSVMTNLQDYILKHRLFKTFQADNLLFVEYKCLVEEQRSSIWTHHNYFAYVLGGRKEWKTRHGNYLASSGDALFVKKGAHAVYQYFEEPFLVLFLFVPDEFIQGVLAKYHQLIDRLPRPGRSDDMVVPLLLNPVLQSFFQSLFAFFLEPRAPHPAILRLKVEELILNLLCQSDNTDLQGYFLQLGRRQKADLEHIMRSYFNYPLSLADYARLCARSLSSFRRDFKANFHTTPSKWLMQERLAYAKFLLETTDRTLQAIIHESGFKNRSHFLRAFKNAFGCTPSQFRRSRTTQG